MAFLDKAGVEYLWTHIISKLGNKVDKIEGKGLSTNDYTIDEKNKLAGIAEGATKVTVDSALSPTSTNPVQNKVINSAISNIQIYSYGATAPNDTKLLWIDSSSGGVLKYYNGSAWTAIKSVWG